jgi:acetyl esterase/lipase
LLPVLLLLGACSPRRIAETFLIGDHFARTTDIAYAEGERHRLDVYRPNNTRDRLPVVVFIHGGRWQTGSKDEYRLLGDALTDNGVVVVIPNYRLHPEVNFPGWVEDAARAVRWTHENIQRFGGDTTQIWVVGHSAGAHTAVLLALNEHYLRDMKVPDYAVRGYISLAGPVETEWTDPDVQTLMGPRSSWAASYPATYIDGSEKPLLLLHGADDKTDWPLISTRLADLIRARGGCAEVVVYEGIGHIKIAAALMVPELDVAPVMEDVLAFIRGGSACGR